MASENGASAVAATQTKLFINGSFVDAVSGKTFQTIDPRTGEAIAEVAEANKEDVDIAVAAARNAFEEGPWPLLSGAERGRILFKWADLIEKHAKELAALETLDNGKPLQMSIHVDLPISLRLIRHFAGWADKIQGSTFKIDGPFHGYTLYEPIGVVGAIIPWNFPIAMFFLKAAPALVCGNTLVLKSAEQTPLTALYLASLSKEAGVPPGVLNVLSGYGPTAGAAIASHMNVDKIAFTGSTNVGRLIMEMSAKSNLKPVTLECGGKSPIIICNDADLDQAVEIAHQGLFFNQGQVCVAGSRIFVQEEIYEEYIRKAAERAKQVVVGDPFKAETQQGPQVDQDQFNIIMGYIEAGKGEGAKLLTGGSRFGTKGYYIEPTVFTDVQDNMKIAREEIFGPVMSILKFKSLEEAIERANNTIYGLAAGIVTKNWDVANRLSRAIKAGTVWINCYGSGDSVMPYGGYKMSGIGRERGIMGLHNYLQIKSVITPLKDAPWL